MFASSASGLKAAAAEEGESKATVEAAAVTHADSVSQNYQPLTNQHLSHTSSNISTMTN